MAPSQTPAADRSLNAADMLLKGPTVAIQPAPGGFRNVDSAAVVRHDPPHLAQAEAEAPPGLTPAEKRVEQAPPRNLIEAGPAIRHCHPREIRLR